MNVERAGECLRKWQRVLRLSDWDIKLTTVSTDWRKSGDVKIDRDNRMAAVLLHESIPEEHLEEVLVHELLHLKVYGMDQMIERLIELLYPEEEDPGRAFAMDSFMLELETTVEDLTKAMLTAGGENREFWFKRVDRQIDEELRGR
ncbi:MAG TPA: hypothetical protein PLM22_06365 [Candidatus Sabulitectum sp.]|nr:hypothetical protein [Candidatus Sabulitectum sp.]HPF33724.1 hypothetical protein [Candidatus Sabulitectum sp.]HPJ28540.1 hypothetical protein [Candidatus Sabulitectum sp.]HPR23467.1 hypothetical protein [Candidatus Sabulitectum sp.]